MTIHKWNELSESTRAYMRMMESRENPRSTHQQLDEIPQLAKHIWRGVRHLIKGPGGRGIDIPKPSAPPGFGTGSLSGTIDAWHHDMNNLIMYFTMLFGNNDYFTQVVRMLNLGDTFDDFINFSRQIAGWMDNFHQGNVDEIFDWFGSIQIGDNTIMDFLQFSNGQLSLRGWDGSRWNGDPDVLDPESAVFGFIQYIIDGINSGMNDNLAQILQEMFG